MHVCFATTSHQALTYFVISHRTRIHGLQSDVLYVIPYVSMCVCVHVCVCVLQTSYQTEADTLHLQSHHHLHKAFPVCRAIPAPVFPPLPSHTYQPSADVPFPESGSSPLDTLDKQKQLIHLTLFFCFLKLSLGALSIWQYHVKSHNLTYFNTSI